MDSTFINKKLRRLVFALPVLAGCFSLSAANERHFTYTYESAVLPPGAREMELWTTYRSGRDEYYTEMDYRAEYEIGLTNKLMTAFYLNWKDVASQDNSTNPPSIKKEHEFQGISSEWKYKMTDPVANKIGSALYGEVSVGTDEFGFEGKLILDKRIGNHLFAYNIVVEPEWHRKADGGTTTPEVEFENNLGYTHFFTSRFAAGVEVRGHSEFTSEDKPEHVALFAGPVVSYAAETWWVAFTAMGQLPAIKRSVNDQDSSLVLDEHERFNARLLLSFHL